MTDTDLTLPQLAELEFWLSNNANEKWTAETAVTFGCVFKRAVPKLLALARRALEQEATWVGLAEAHAAGKREGAADERAAALEAIAEFRADALQQIAQVRKSLGLKLGECPEVTRG